jgi:hypothetical protein
LLSKTQEKSNSSMSRYGSEADRCSATGNVRFTPKNDREGRHPRTAMSALPLNADMCGATSDVGYGPEADSARSYPSAILDGLADYAFAGWTFNVRLS